MENTYDKANKICQLRDDQYSYSHYGYVYLIVSQRDEIIMNDESKSKEELFRDPITQQPRVLDDSEVARNFLTCMFICIMQLTMTISTLIYFGKPTSDGPNKNADPLFITYVVRLMCQLALHMLIDPEVFQSIQMIKFALYRCNSFRLRSCHILIALM